LNPTKPARCSNFRIEEIDGKIYSVATLDARPRGPVQDMYQRLASPEAPLRTRWSGTTLGADYDYEKIQQRQDQLARLNTEPSESQ
jgi:hypothetical protein